MAHRKHDDAERARPTGGERSVGNRDLNGNATRPEAYRAVVTDTASGAVTGRSAAGGASTGVNGGGVAIGRSTTDVVNPTEEEAYWREAFLSRPYADETLGYDHYRPAYRYGWESRTRHPDRRWDQVERELESGWRVNRGNSRLGWTDAKLAARDAWQRVDRRLLDQREHDRLHDQRSDDEHGERPAPVGIAGTC